MLCYVMLSIEIINSDAKITFHNNINQMIKQMSSRNINTPLIVAWENFKFEKLNLSQLVHKLYLIIKTFKLKE